MRRTRSGISVLLVSAAVLVGCGNSADKEESTPAPSVSLVSGSGQCDTPTTPFCDSTVAPPAGWDGHIFKLAQDYPATVAPDTQPWLAFDPTAQSQEFVQSVLDYFYAGNIRDSVENSFDPTLNTVRQWYNAPWQDFGFNGREPAHGLTRERVNKPGELDPAQTLQWNNYAVGFYNAAGASAIGKVWANHGSPDAAMGIMPEGTVGAKLLFTTAGTDQVPYLAGSPAWNVYVYSELNSSQPDPTERAKVAVRLLQIDLAVKDQRSPTGWVFGTFVYGGGPTPGTTQGTGWTNVSPVGVMWGNDPDYSGSGPLKETWINSAVTMPHLGYQGRLNGPVDNPSSSCLSCHSTAQTPSDIAPMFPPTQSQIPYWFRNVPSGQVFMPTEPPAPPAVSLDYSLQVSIGIQNYLSQQAEAADPNARRAPAADATPPRDGGPSH
ncbi:MAG: hypothetical protein ACR2HV_08990 [Acidimicrobiales bacterium]